MILAYVMILSMAVHAQWRVGATVGTDYNLYTMDKQYETDWQHRDWTGMTFTTNICPCLKLSTSRRR